MKKNEVFIKNNWVLLPREIDPFGVVGIGGELTVERLKDAYSQGVFPWPQKLGTGYELVWACPQDRGVLFFKDFKVSSRLEQKKRNLPYQYKHNKSFSEVIKACAETPRRTETGTWITDELISVYTDFHKAGYAHSFECWESEKLIGGLYGVLYNGVFSGESVFGLKSDVSKLCLMSAVEYLKSLGHDWMDIQMVTPLTEAFGGRYISRKEYFKLGAF